VCRGGASAGIGMARRCHRECGVAGEGRVVLKNVYIGFAGEKLD
jgi:hypothetical protein